MNSINGSGSSRGSRERLKGRKGDIREKSGKKDMQTERERERQRQGNREAYCMRQRERKREP